MVRIHLAPRATTTTCTQRSCRLRQRRLGTHAFGVRLTVEGCSQGAGVVDRGERDRVVLRHGGFTDGTITLQPITRVSLSLSTALIGFVEASGRTTTEKNRLCRPNPWPHTPFDFTRHLLTGMKNEMEWQGAPDVMAWVNDSRLNLVKSLAEDPDQAEVADLQRRFVTALFPALTKLDELASHATPAERARMFEPVA